MRKHLTLMGTVVVALSVLLTGCSADTNSSNGIGSDEPVINANVSDDNKENPAEESAVPAEGTADPSEDNVEPAKIYPVWVGTKKDVMYEYYLMFTSKEDVYVLEMVDGNTKRIEKGTYSIGGENLKFEGISMIKKADYHESNKMIGATMALADLLFYFTPSDMPIFDQTTLDALMETNGPEVAHNNKNPERNDDGTYSYYVDNVQVRSTINIWDYVNGEDFDLYRLLEDHGYEFKLREYPNPSKGSNEVYPYKYLNVAKNGKKEIHCRPQDPWMDRNINEKGLASIESYMTSPRGYIFYPSSADKAEAIYSVNSTDEGVSIDQMIFIACMIDYNAQGGLGDAVFLNILYNNNRLIP